MKKKSILTSILLITTVSFAFDFGSLAKDVVSNITESVTGDKKETSSLSNDIISSGLKQALEKGVTYAVKELGAKDGYLNNTSVKIPLPGNLAKVETVIRKVGGDKIADNLINSMNNAATTAAPKTATIFMDAIEKMNLTDAKAILAGNNTAAADYFEKNTTTSLKTLISPIIQDAMKENEVSGYYETANKFYKDNVSSYVADSSTMDIAKSLGVDSYIPSNDDESLNEYVTQKAIDGLFKIIAEKESAIRENPIEQTTSLLKKVFSK